MRTFGLISVNGFQDVFHYVRPMFRMLRDVHFGSLIFLWTSGFVSYSLAASGHVGLQDTIYSVRLRNGDIENGHILYKDSIRTTLENRAGEIQNFPNQEITNVSIMTIRTTYADPFRLYATPGASLTTDGGGIGLTLLMPSNWGLEFKYRSLSYHSFRKPDDYNPGGHYEQFCAWILFCFDDYVYETNPDPYDLSDQYSLCVHRKYGSSSAMLRLGWQAGVTYMKFSYYEFSRKSVNGPFGSNYNVTQKFSRVSGVQAGISLDLPVTRYWGLELGILGQLNKQHNMLIVELDSPLGLIRSRRRQPHGD